MVGQLLVRARMTPLDGFAGAERSLTRAKVGLAERLHSHCKRRGAKFLGGVEEAVRLLRKPKQWAGVAGLWGWTFEAGLVFGLALSVASTVVYSHLAEGRHQWCWSHLRRDFQVMVDRNNAGSAIGKELLAMSGQMLGWWKRVRDGTLTKVAHAA